MVQLNKESIKNTTLWQQAGI
ncbi:MAG: hypothetical protein K0R22_2387, partial [Sporomusa sp.]|nr:hypothetical protein [Sporomusa sp.]